LRGGEQLLDVPPILAPAGVQLQQYQIGDPRRPDRERVIGLGAVESAVDRLTPWTASADAPMSAVRIPARSSTPRTSSSVRPMSPAIRTRGAASNAAASRDDRPGFGHRDATRRRERGGVRVPQLEGDADTLEGGKRRHLPTRVFAKIVGDRAHARSIAAIGPS